MEAAETSRLPPAASTKLVKVPDAALKATGAMMSPVSDTIDTDSTAAIAPPSTTLAAASIERGPPADQRKSDAEARTPPAAVTVTLPAAVTPPSRLMSPAAVRSMSPADDSREMISSCSCISIAPPEAVSTRFCPMPPAMTEPTRIGPVVVTVTPPAAAEASIRFSPCFSSPAPSVSMSVIEPVVVVAFVTSLTATSSLPMPVTASRVSLPAMISISASPAPISRITPPALIATPGSVVKRAPAARPLSTRMASASSAVAANSPAEIFPIKTSPPAFSVTVCPALFVKSRRSTTIRSPSVLIVSEPSMVDTYTVSGSEPMWFTVTSPAVTTFRCSSLVAVLIVLPPSATR